jgi:hypothetical protein
VLVLGDSVVVRGPTGSAVRHHRDGTTRTYAHNGHVIVALDEDGDTIVTSDGASIWIWEHGLARSGLDVRAVAARTLRHTPEVAVARVERCAAQALSCDTLGRAVNVPPQPPYGTFARRAPIEHLPSVVFGIGLDTLVAVQLGHAELCLADEHAYRSIAATPPGDEAIRERRLLAWSDDEQERFFAIVELSDGRMAIGEPGAVEIAFDGTLPQRVVIEDIPIADVLVSHVVRPTRERGWRAVIAFRHYVTTLEERDGVLVSRAVVARSRDEQLVGADAEARPIVRSGRDLFLVHADGTRRPLASDVDGELGVSADGRVLAHRTNGGGFRWLDLA